MNRIFRTFTPVAATLLLTPLLWILPRPADRAPWRITPGLSPESEAAELTETGGEFSDENSANAGVTGKQPNDWFMAQRVGPDGTLNMEAVRDAQRQAMFLRNLPHELDELWTLAGPTNIGGRITGIAVNPSDVNIVYAAGAIGGVFKSYNGGNNFAPIFDADFAQSGGAIAIDPNDPDRIWYGSGEANASGDSYPGNGIFLSEDAGTTWNWMGLPESYHIGRIQVDPSNSDRIFVAVTGKLFGFNPERGVYRSDDGGAAWDRVLFVNDTTGCIDLELNLLNPDTVFAVTWDRYRLPNHRQVSGVHSGVWRSGDGGDTWEHLTNGLPVADNVGRGSLAISPDHPDRLYLTFSDHPGNFLGSWRSDDGGDSWINIGLDHAGSVYSNFGWYFGENIVEPGDPNTAYTAGVRVVRTENAGVDWVYVFDDAHVDHHAFFIDPAAPNRIISGHDGGVNRSQNRGNSSYIFGYLPATQFYAITHDPSMPQRLYGGTQDNGTMRTLTGAINDWDEIYYGDGFYCLVNPINNDIIYACSQYGNIGRSDDGGQWFDSINNDFSSDRTNWMTPFCFDPFNPDRLYLGTYRVWRTTDRGDSWTDISGDLTDGDDPGNLVYGTITTIEASRVSQGLVIVGTDDHHVWYSPDDSGDWIQIDNGLPALWVSRVATHPDSANIFYVAFSGHRVSDPTPHLYRSDDSGVTWTNISGDEPEGSLPDGPINDVIIDPDDTARLYVGTDFGVFATLDYGHHWSAVGEGLPMSAVFDIDFVDGERRLIAGTHGRSMYSYELGPLEGVDSKPRPLPVSDRLILASFPNPFNSSTTIRVNLPRPGALKLTVYDLLGRQVATLADEKQARSGVSEWVWNAHSDAGLPLASGTYIVVITTEHERSSRRIQLVK